MEGQTSAGIKNQPLHEAIRPRGHPDQAGALGQKIHELANELENKFPESSVLIASTPEEIWIGICRVLYSMARPIHCRFIRKHLPALRALQKHAEQ